MSAGIGMTAEMATRVMRDAVAISSRKAALEEIAARQERLRRFAGTETRTLLPPRSPATATPAPRTSSLPSSSAGPSAPVPLGWTQRPGGGSTGQVGFSMQTGDPAAGAPVKMQRALTRAPARDKRDPIAVESDLSCCEQKAVRPRSTPGYQRAFLLMLAFLVGLGTWPLDRGEVTPGVFRREASRTPSLVDASLVDYFDYLYFSGSMAHEAEKAKASALHCANFLEYPRDLPRTARALRGFRKVAPGSSRFPLPAEIFGALQGQLITSNHCEMALAFALMFIAYLRPSELFGLRVCDVIMRAGHVVINLAPGDTNVVTKTGLQDEGVWLENKIWPGLIETLEKHLSDLGYTTASAATALKAVCRLSASKGYPCDLVSRLDFRRSSSPVPVFQELL